MLYDIAVIGGGAAGLCAALHAKMKNRKLNIVVCEMCDRVGKKLITTGNGRCNITNRYACISSYHSNDISLVADVFQKYSVDDAAEFFEKIGVNIVFHDDGRAYPRSYQASSVVDALRFAAEEYNIEIRNNCKVLDFKKDGVFLLNTSVGVITARTVIAATGLLSGGAKVGSDGSFFEIMKKKGFKTVNLTPAITQIKTETDITKQLKGIKLDADAALVIGGKTVRQEFGEVLFTDYGLSGPPILQLSREVPRSKGEMRVVLDLLPEYDFRELSDILYERKNNLSMRTNENFLTGFLNKRVGQAVLKKCGLNLGDSVSSLRDSDIKNIAAALKKFEFRVTGTTGFGSSQVTAGGVSTTEFGSDLQSHKIGGFFIAGELLDVDGDCGGFNLQWAWSSAMLAADGAINALGDIK